MDFFSHIADSNMVRCPRLETEGYGEERRAKRHQLRGASATSAMVHMLMLGLCEHSELGRSIPRTLCAICQEITPMTFSSRYCLLPLLDVYLGYTLEALPLPSHNPRYHTPRLSPQAKTNAGCLHLRRSGTLRSQSQLFL